MSLETKCISSLPDEVLGNIFAFLTLRERFAVQRVCKKWLDMATRSAADVVFIYLNKVPSAGLCDVIAYSKNNVLLVTNCNDVYKFLKQLPHVKSIYFHMMGYKIFEDHFDFIQIGELLAEIEEFHFESFFNGGTPRFIKLLSDLLRRCTSLKTLDINVHGAHFSHDFWSSVISRNRIVSLCMPNCTHCGDSGENHDREYILKHHADFLKDSLISLKMPSDKITIDSKLQLLRLQELTVRSVSLPIENKFNAVLENLKILEIGINSGMNCDQLLGMLVNCKYLSVLSLGKIATDLFIEQLTSVCPRLTDLRLFECFTLTDVSLLYLMKLTHLEVLHIGESLITDHAMSSFIQAAPLLRAIYADNDSATALIEKANSNQHKVFFGCLVGDDDEENNIPNNLFLFTYDDYSPPGFWHYYFGIGDIRYNYDYYCWKKVRNWDPNCRPSSMS